MVLEYRKSCITLGLSKQSLHEYIPDYGTRNYMYAPDVVQGNDGRYYLYYCMSGEYGVGGYHDPIQVAVCCTTTKFFVDNEKCCAIILTTNTDKSIDEEEYILFRMNREKVVGENFREGSMEVAFELWTERMIPSRLQRRFPPLSGEAISELH